AMKGDDFTDLALVDTTDQSRQVPHADKRRSAVAAKAARPDQQREKIAFAALDFPLMDTGLARSRSREQRNRPPSRLVSPRSEARQPVFDQPEVNQRDRRALTDGRHAASMQRAEPARCRDAV